VERRQVESQPSFVRRRLPPTLSTRWAKSEPVLSRRFDAFATIENQRFTMGELCVRLSAAKMSTCLSSERVYFQMKV